MTFGARDGIYYRTQEPNEEGGAGEVELVDYGFDAGSPTEPVVAGRIDRPEGVHNVEAHPTEPVLYVVNGRDGGGEVGLTVYDTADPTAPEQVASAVDGRGNHDITFDAERDLIHSAFIDGDFVGWIGHDVSDPTNPEEVGRFSYAGRPGYDSLDTVGFGSCHYARADPERDLLYLGDETAQGVPAANTSSTSATARARSRSRATSVSPARRTHNSRTATTRCTTGRRTITTSSTPATRVCSSTAATTRASSSST